MQRALALVLIAVSAVLLFWRLDAAPLWRDEGTTAVWARQLAQSGTWLPYVYDFDKEQLMVQAADGHDVNSRLLPAMQSYLQFYVVGLSFKLFGVNEWTARAPAALLGALLLLVLYGVGRELYGKSSVMALAPPALAVTSIFFLHAARQSRYYILAALAGALILYELVRFLNDRSLLDSKSFWARLAAWGLLLYFSNYLGFLGGWTAVGVFVLAERDRTLFKRFAAVCAGMAVIVMTDFGLLHAEFAGSWPPPRPQPIWEVYQGALAARGRDLWRIVPLVFLAPVGAWLYLRDKDASAGMKAGFGLAVLLVLAPLALFDSRDVGALSTPAFWAAAVVFLIVPGVFVWALTRLPEPGPVLRAAWLAGLILVVSLLVTVAVGRYRGFTRHAYQIMPAISVLCSTALYGAARHKGAAPAAALFAGMAVWPNLDNMMGGTEQVVQRQFMADRSYLGPLLDFFDQNLQPGDRVAFSRNVKGMAAYFYFPEMRWVGLLDEAAPHNAKFRGMIPDDQFKQGADADWWVIWDQRDEPAPGLNDSDYELVWDYSYPTYSSWWDRDEEPRVRTYEVWKKRAKD